MEMVLVGTGACTAFDVVLILRKNGQDVRDCEVALTSERAEVDPKVFTTIGLHFTIVGKALKPHLVEHAIKLSREKYCSATAMLSKTAHIAVSWNIREDSG
jgi:putative redox protein